MIAAGCGRLGFTSEIPADASVTPDGDGDVALDAASIDTRPCTVGLWTSTLSTLPAWANTWRFPVTGSLADVTVSGGELVVTTPPDPDNFAGLLSRSPMGFAGRRQRVRVVRVPAESKVFFGLDEPNVTLLRMVYAAGQMSIGAEPVSVPFDPVARPFWQVREADGTVYFDSSSDGIAYTAIGSVPTPTFLTSDATLVVGAGTEAAVTSAGSAAFDDLVHCDP
jgi:hypothetical protein